MISIPENEEKQVFPKLLRAVNLSFKVNQISENHILGGFHLFQNSIYLVNSVNKITKIFKPLVNQFSHVPIMNLEKFCFYDEWVGSYNCFISFLHYTVFLWSTETWKRQISILPDSRLEKTCKNDKLCVLPYYYSQLFDQQFIVVVST